MPSVMIQGTVLSWKMRQSVVRVSSQGQGLASVQGAGVFKVHGLILWCAAVAGRRRLIAAD